MAEKRMFSHKITDSDSFSDMTLSAQALYFHLNMHADDDGIVNNPRRIQKAIGATDADFAELVEKRFLLIIDGVTIVKHWRINNTIREDRKQKSTYPDILAKLTIKENGAYTLNQATKSQPRANQATGNRQANVGQMTGNCRASDRQMSGECPTSDGQVTGNRQANVGVDKNSIDKNSIDKNSLKDIDHRSGDHAQEQPEVVTLLEKRFEEFWSLYPRKVGKLKAFQSFKRINPKKELFDQMMDALRENIASNAQWKRDNGQYIPHPTTWLNQGRWFDEISTDAPGAAEDFFTRALKGEVDY